jgi:hypothetical protein
VARRLLLKKLPDEKGRCRRLGFPFLPCGYIDLSETLKEVGISIGVLHPKSLCRTCIRPPIALMVIALVVAGVAQQQTNQPAQPTANQQINVNWLYGSYVPKNAELRSLTRGERFKLYIRQTYLTPGIYIKTTLFALRDHIADSNPEWGEDFAGFAKRLGNRQAQFVIQNSLTSLGDGILGWEPRYDRCRCDHFWPRTRHAIQRNLVTYGSSERSFRPQLMPYLSAFSASAIATTWQPGNPSWQVKGYQAVVTQFFVGAGINWIGEFAPEITRVLRRKKRNKSAHP